MRILLAEDERSLSRAVTALLAGTLSYDPDTMCDHHGHGEGHDCAHHGGGHSCGHHSCGG